MKKIVALLFSIVILSSCKSVTGENIDIGSITENNETESTYENTVKIVSTTDISDDKLKDMYLYAENLMTSSESFIQNTGGKFLNESGETPAEFKKRFEQTFTTNFSNKYFELYAPTDMSISWDIPTLWFCMYKETVDYFIENNDYSESDFVKLEIDDLTNCKNYGAIQIGGYTKGSDISIHDNELTVTSRCDDKIVLTMTVWHQNPEYEKKIGKDYVYYLENGNLVISGKFGGVDEYGEDIIVEDELSGTIVDVPVGKDKYEFSHNQYDNYLVKYDYTLIFDRGFWKFDNFVIWD